MKRIKGSSLVSIVILFCLSNFAYAAGIGNSMQPVGKYKFSFSLEDNFIIDKPIKATDDFVTFDFAGANQIYGKVVFGLADNINVYVKMGSSDSGKIKQSFADSSTTEIQSNYGLLWGGGISGSVDAYKGLRVGLDLQYGGWQVTPNDICESDNKATNISGQIYNQEYQATLFVTKELSLNNDEFRLSPYLGGRLSYFNTRTKKTLQYDTSAGAYQLSWNEKNKNKVGLVLGTDLFLPKYLLQLNIEGRLFDETALTAGLTYRR